MNDTLFGLYEEARELLLSRCIKLICSVEFKWRQNKHFKSWTELERAHVAGVRVVIKTKAKMMNSQDPNHL